MPPIHALVCTAWKMREEDSFVKDSIIAEKRWTAATWCQLITAFSDGGAILTPDNAA